MARGLLEEEGFKHIKQEEDEEYNTIIYLGNHNLAILMQFSNQRRLCTG
jgi:hypothetical protein